MENKFLTFIKPYLSYIDNGHFFRKPFSWLYSILAVINLLFPLVVIYKASDNRIFDSQGKFIAVFLLVWIVVAFAGWISFQLWWDRKAKISTSSAAGDEFIATPVFSHFIQTLGEWIGTYIGLVGFCFALFTTLFLGGEGYYMSGSIGIPFMESGWVSVIVMPVTGFLIIVISRFLAEQIKALSSIANNTRKP